MLKASKCRLCERNGERVGREEEFSILLWIEDFVEDILHYANMKDYNLSIML